MRRSIQFKAYDKQQKKWICDYQRGIPAHYRGSQYPPEHGKVDYMCIYVIADESFTDCDLCLYTGHKDKNGMGIYEGDLLKYDDPDKQKGHEEPYLIRWDSEEACFECVNSTNFMMASVWINMEIIGNRFETPELIPMKYSH